MANKSYVVWLIATLKGGVRKSTSAMFLAFSEAAKGREVLVIDADAGTQGVTDWGSRVYTAGGELPFDVAQWAHSQGLLVPFVQQQAAQCKSELVIIDVGGEAAEVVKQAAFLADVIISPTGPEQGEIGRIEATKAVVASSGRPHCILLTRVPEPGKGAAKDTRLDLVEDGYTVLETEVRQNRDLYSHVWGSVPTNLGVYPKVAGELNAIVGQGVPA